MINTKKKKPDMVTVLLTQQEIQALYFTLEAAMNKSGVVREEHHMPINWILNCIEEEVSQ